MIFEKIHIGYFVMGSGAKIPYAAKRFKVEYDLTPTGRVISKIDSEFTNHRTIGIPWFVNWVDVKAIVSQKEVYRLKRWW